jgi:antitoxin MazE
MRTRLGKWGNSWALRIPQHVAREWNVEKTRDVTVTWDAGKLVVEPVADDIPTLDEMLARCDDSNRHPEWDLGSAVGREVW